MSYFKDCKTQDELKAKYKMLAKQHHPDLGGDVEEMKRVNEEYSKALKTVVHSAGSCLSDSEIDDIIRNDEELRRKLYALLGIAGIDIELCGTWLWVTGNTKDVKEELKRNGLRWAHKKSAWYFHTGTFRKRSKVNYSLDDIRARHGSTSLTGHSVNRKAIA